MLDNVIPRPDAVPRILLRSASWLWRWPHALSTVICVPIVYPSLDLIIVYCAVCSLLVYRVCHHRQHQVIHPLPRLAGPPAPSYQWINELWYGDLLACTPSYCYMSVRLQYGALYCPAC